LTKKSFKVNFAGDKCEIRSNEGTKQYAVADLHENLYRLRQSQWISHRQSSISVHMNGIMVLDRVIISRDAQFVEEKSNVISEKSIQISEIISNVIKRI